MTTEAQLHKAVAEYLAVALPPDAVWTTFPAGGGGKARGAQLKARGLRAGWPDIQILAKGQFVGIELKTPKGPVSNEQTLCHLAIRSAGGDAFVCRSLKDVEFVLEKMMGMRPRAVVFGKGFRTTPATGGTRSAA